jgi:hypothetical protein
LDFLTRFQTNYYLARFSLLFSFQRSKASQCHRIGLLAALAILTRFVFRVNRFLFGRQRITAPQLHLQSNERPI